MQEQCRTETILDVAFADNSKKRLHLPRLSLACLTCCDQHPRELRRCDDDRITCMNPQGVKILSAKEKDPKISHASHNRATDDDGAPDLRRRQDGLFRHCRTRALRTLVVDLSHRSREELPILRHSPERHMATSLPPACLTRREEAPSRWRKRS